MFGGQLKDFCLIYINLNPKKQMKVSKKSRRGKESVEVDSKVNELRVNEQLQATKSKLRSGNYKPLTLQLLELKVGRQNELVKLRKSMKK